ncbi:MAG: DUF4224 domain-containing protein [Betaproteobacteria bacterium]|nr:DUF4224 domain-containing protein [Betaproteobacteria bacterium]
MFLTPDEIAELTDRLRPAEQIEWLRAHRWVFEVGAKGRPKVLRAYALARLGGAEQNHKAEPKLHLA